MWVCYPKQSMEPTHHIHHKISQLINFNTLHNLSNILSQLRCLSLWYDFERGASHALHVDDLWLWGPRILGVSLQSPSVFTFFDPANAVCVRVPLPRRSATGMLKGFVCFLVFSQRPGKALFWWVFLIQKGTYRGVVDYGMPLNSKGANPHQDETWWNHFCQMSELWQRRGFTV